MSDLVCNCRACIVRRRAEAYEPTDDPLPSQDDLTELPDDLGTDYGEPESEPLVDD